MKYSLLYFCLLQASLVYGGYRPSFVSDEMIAVAASVVNVCQAQTGVATADIEAVRNGHWPETQSLKCYMYCLWEQFGLIDEKRELSLNTMLTFFQRIPAYREEVQGAAFKCKAIGKYFANGDNCKYAYTFNQCYAELSPRRRGLISCPNTRDNSTARLVRAISKMNKIVILVCALALMAVGIKGAAVPVELQESGKVARNICLEQTGISVDLIDKAILGDFSEDENFKCYFKCLLEQFGVFENGVINFDIMLALVPDSIKETGTKAVQDCRGTTGKDMCDQAYNLEKCFYKINPETFFII
ncbi:uncharacterized protein [Venturia canescens]|uniref:uncharacterized protein n=1 Tax=Venturia canescens TaxID=32260 RepID=UPI001C9BDAA1|nr:uncharacterized protein LOC122416602 [Venturia canescens]